MRVKGVEDQSCSGEGTLVVKGLRSEDHTYLHWPQALVTQAGRLLASSIVEGKSISCISLLIFAKKWKLRILLMNTHCGHEEIGAK